MYLYNVIVTNTTIDGVLNQAQEILEDFKIADEVRDDTVLEDSPSKTLKGISSSSTIDQSIGSDPWRKDPLFGLAGPKTRSRAKQMKDALNSLIVQALQEESKSKVQDKPKIITLLEVIGS